MRFRKTGLAAAGLSLCAGIFFLGTGPSSASNGFLSGVTTTTVNFNSINGIIPPGGAASLNVNCPAGQVAVGGGYSLGYVLNGGTGLNVWLNEASPNSGGQTPTQWSFSAINDSSATIDLTNPGASVEVICAHVG
jgi:hypothetical protein